MKDREMWMDKLKEKLENYSEPIPPFGWEQLEKELVPPAPKRILYPYRRWGAIAATVLLVVASSLSIYFLNTPTADEIRYTVAPVLASDPDLLSPAHDPDMQVAKVEPVQPRPVIAQARKMTERQGFEPTTLTAYISATLLSKFQIGNETVTIFRCWACPTLTAVCLPNFRVQRYGFLLKLANI